MLNSYIKRITNSFVFGLLFSISALAQGSEIEMADNMRSNGKIYVVVLTVLIILIGLFLFLIYLDKKISKLEK